MADKFFTQETCDRCKGSLVGGTRKMSWFTEECLCEKCSTEEKHLREALEKEGTNTYNLEGCGYIPRPKGE